MPPTADDPPDAEFHWSADAIRRVGHEVADWIATYLTSLPAAPVFQPVPTDLAAAMLATPVPDDGESLEAILARFRSEIGAYPFGNGHPRFSAWVNSPPAAIGIFAQALAAAMNPSVAGGNHAAVWIERQVLEWFKTIFGFPHESMGLLVSGSSAAAITGLAVARHSAAARIGWDMRKRGAQIVDSSGAPVRMLIYESAEAHSCHQKAVELLGLGSAQIRVVPSDAELRMRPEALDEMLAADIAAGALPVAVIASAGTVNTGAIDPLEAIADVCARHHVWMHVDGGYGAPAILTSEYRASLAAISRADSVGIDAHKWMYVPVDAGVVLIRDAKLMRDAFSLVPPYLRSDDDQHGVQGPPWLSEYGSEQTRPFRALKVWMALRYFGTSGYARLIAHDIAMARRLAARVRITPMLELREPVGLSIVCFRVRPPSLHGDDAAIDALNQRVLAALQLGGRAFLSSTVLGGRTWLRSCIVNPGTMPEDVDAVLDAVLDTVNDYL
ncbi:MAG TPA: aminotransferase class V-fold PLP-dependent enzyme [Gemmatimonadaceae bacterium]|nr:aminotransferase class V-fold PLP-dependent enzyme [Gemmatimonadaceae bacterium]